MNIISGVSSSDLDNESLKRSSWMKIIEKTSAMSKMLQLQFEQKDTAMRQSSYYLPGRVGSPWVSAGGRATALLHRHNDDRSQRSMDPCRYYEQFCGIKAASLAEILSHDDSRLGCLLPRWLGLSLPFFLLLPLLSV
ncbi:uncharacterized protein LOC114873742 isoform X1 [Osmia bicornis bicornis]|uniref:uncharacterized protein LOC114873742 isoform X1 n=1 Tax=Osmia bicornis bicornis TaxID=1437191 RepID=UPI001EAF48C5|nr:uncharacterized protein LOC114873742 isoform X1 [Osmia bicornis bicornis]